MSDAQKKTRLEKLSIQARALALAAIAEATNELLEHDRDALVWLLSDMVCEMHGLITEEKTNDH